MLLIEGQTRVWIGIDAYPGKKKEDGYFHLLHIKRVIAVYFGYLLLHDGSEGFQLGGSTLVPTLRNCKIYLFLHILIF